MIHLSEKNSIANDQNNIVIIVHSYACDDYVINETQSKRILRVLEHFQNNQVSTNKSIKRKDDSEISLVSYLCKLN